MLGSPHHYFLEPTNLLGRVQCSNFALFSFCSLNNVTLFLPELVPAPSSLSLKILPAFHTVLEI